MLLTCFLAALGAFLNACWAQLEGSWAPLRLNLEPLGRLWVSSSGLLAASRAPHGSLWRLLGQLGALWPPNRLQMDAKWAPNGRQMGAIWMPSGRQVGLSSWTATTAANVSVHLKNATTAAKCHSTPCQQYFLSLYSDRFYASIYIYIYIYILVLHSVAIR